MRGHPSGWRGVGPRWPDVVEALTVIDPAEITALLAANLMFELIGLLALRKKESQAAGP